VERRKKSKTINFLTAHFSEYAWFFTYFNTCSDALITQFVASAAQIAEIGNGQDITDFNNTFNVSRFIAIMQKEIPATISEALF